MKLMAEEGGVGVGRVAEDLPARLGPHGLEMGMDIGDAQPPCPSGEQTH
jgi:hypothetical protein